MKRNRIMGLALMFIGLCVAVIIVSKEGVGWSNKQALTAFSSQTENITISVSNMNIRVVPEARDDVLAQLQGSGSVAVQSTDDGIQITAERGRFSLFPFQCTLDVYLPQSYSHNLSLKLDEGNVALSGPSQEGDAAVVFNDVNIRAQSSKTVLEHVEIASMSFSVSSGGFQGKSLQINHGAIDMTTGTIQLQNYRGNVEAHVDSGEVSASEVHVETGIFEAKTGQIRLDRYSGKLQGSLGAGEFTAGFEQVNGAVDVKVGKGRAELGLPSDASYRLAAEAKLGDVDNQLDSAAIEKQTKQVVEASNASGTFLVNVQVSAGEIALIEPQPH